MSRRGRGMGWVNWGVLGLVCLAGLGCHFSVNYSLTKPEQPPVEGDATEAPPTLPQPGEDVQQTAFTPERLKPGEAVPMPTKVDEGVAAPDRPVPAMQTSTDPLIGVPPSPGIPSSDAPPGCFAPGGFNRLPTEIEKKSHPPYVVEPPDLLILDAGRLVPRPPYVIQAFDVLVIQATETFPNQPINGQYSVGPDGTITLGFGYGTVPVSGLTLEKAQTAVRTQLEKTLKKPAVSLGLGSFQSGQQVQGTHLVRPDGTLSLGIYGCVYITGMTLSQAQTAIEQHLAQFFQDPEISLDVHAYNSKAYYVIVDSVCRGQKVAKFPITGNETVLDAIHKIGGLPAAASRQRIWVARPTPANHECVQILPVDWEAVTQSGSTRTNYQLFPGDRIFVRTSPLIALDNALARICAPIERVLGITLLGSSTVSSNHNSGCGNGSGFITGH